MQLSMAIPLQPPGLYSTTPSLMLPFQDHQNATYKYSKASKRLPHNIYAADCLPLICVQRLPDVRPVGRGSKSLKAIRSVFVLLPLQEPKSDANFADGHSDADDNQNDDDPRDCAHLRICDRVGQYLGKIEKDTAVFIQHFDSRSDFEVFPNGAVQGMESGLGIPEEVRNIEDVRCY